MSNIKEISTNMKFAIIVAIEDYRKSASSTISKVRYARNDAQAFRKLLLDSFGYEEDEILMLIDQDACKSALENDLPYQIKQLTAEHKFIFYYAGHGFYKDGDNRLTCWDSHPHNLAETCVSIKEVLFDPLLSSNCRKSLIFLDCCSAHLKDGILARDVISDMDTHQFDEFIKPSDYHAVFMSCSPGEKSYSCDVLQHGIWTWHLTEAVTGNVDNAIIKDTFITDASLQNYLSYSVPKYVTKHVQTRGTQRPYAKIHASNNFLIRQIVQSPSPVDKGLPDFKLNYSKAIFRKTDYREIKRATGFKKTHTLPKRRDRTSIKFVQQVFQLEIEDEIERVYKRAKNVLSLRRNDISCGTSLVGGTVECQFFSYHLDVDLEEHNLSRAKFIRKLQIRVPRRNIPDDFDTIFDIYLDELIIPIEGEVDFEDIVSKFENLAEAQGGEVYDSGLTQSMEYITEGGTSITINAHEKELIITHYSPLRSLDLVDKSISDLKKISSHSIKLLG